jgi:molybdate transport system substrate-binding protein
MTRLRTLHAQVALLLLLVAVLAGCGSGGPASTPRVTVRIAAASDLKLALERLRAVVAREHPEIDLRATYGSSGTFRTQLVNGAPFDLFLSADVGFARELVTKGLADDKDVFTYAVGRLVVWTGKDSPVDPAPGLAALADPRIRKVAIANPTTAPYGRAAVAALKTVKQYDAVRPKLVLGESVAQAAEFVTSGNADAGIVAMSLVLSDPLRHVGRWVEVPLTAYPQLLQGGVVLGKAADAGAARQVRDVLLSSAGREVLKEYGFFLPGAS